MRGVTRVYDLVMTHKLDADDFFIHRVQQHCAEAGLNFFLVEPLWVHSFYEGLSKGLVWPRVLLNMHSEHHQPEDIYHRLVRLAAEKNVQVIDPLSRALAAFDKARLHPQLIGAGIHVPHTVIVHADKAAGFQLSEADRLALGSPFVIKPAMGYGRRAVVMTATNEGDLARSVTAWLEQFVKAIEHHDDELPGLEPTWPNTDYLLQRIIVPRKLNGAPAYFRVFFVFGSVWYCWWNCYTDHYRLMTPQEAHDFDLKPLEEIIRRIAALTGMQFFSSEVAQTDSGQFVVIDYVNDQCHMLSQSANARIGVPDELVAAIAKRLVGATKELIGKR